MKKLVNGLVATALSINCACAATDADNKMKEPKAYLTQIARQLRKNYYPPPGTEMSRVIVSFTLGCNGVISSIKIQKPPLIDGHRMPSPTEP